MRAHDKERANYGRKDKASGLFDGMCKHILEPDYRELYFDLGGFWSRAEEDAMLAAPVKITRYRT